MACLLFKLARTTPIICLAIAKSVSISLCFATVHIFGKSVKLEVARSSARDEHVLYDDRSLPAISKDEFSKEVVLDDGGSSSATSLSFLLKREGDRSNYGSLVTLIGLNQDVGDDEQQVATQLSHTAGSSINDFNGVD
ncbi:hypothetical protein Tco_1018153 [Tanacetum coccineum]|uniref:Uncharacterized protein n=1 Tax=Tanacetum coccineum TaxID=301880 RepID=A0ABQ5FTH6_9ASTR